MAANSSLALQVFREEYLSQEGQNREFSSKAIGIVAFSATAFGAVLTFIPTIENEFDSFGCFALVLIAVTTALAVINAAFVVHTGGWKRPFKAEEIRSEAEEARSDSTEFGVCDIEARLESSYAKVIHHNWKILKPKARHLDCLVLCVAAQIILIVLLFSYQVFPETCVLSGLCTG